MTTVKEEYENTVRELKNKLMEYKERLKLEEQKSSQTNDFAFDDDELAKINLENEMLNKRIRAVEEELSDIEKEKKEAIQDSTRMKKAMEINTAQLNETKNQVTELKNLCNRLEITNEALKQNGGGSDKMALATIKQFTDLEKKYIQSKK